MIISDKYKFVFVAIPKTGTRSIYNVCKNKFDGYLLQDHLKIIPDKYKMYYSFTVVRNPYERLISSWWSTTQRNNDPKNYIKYLLKKDTSFLNFCKHLYELEHNFNSPHITPQTKWLEHNKIDFIIRYENVLFLNNFI